MPPRSALTSFISFIASTIADRLALVDDVALLDERRRARLRGAVERADERRDDRVPESSGAAAAPSVRTSDGIGAAGAAGAPAAGAATGAGAPRSISILYSPASTLNCCTVVPSSRLTRSRASSQTERISSLSGPPAFVCSSVLSSGSEQDGLTAGHAERAEALVAALEQLLRRDAEQLAQVRDDRPPSGSRPPRPGSVCAPPAGSGTTPSMIAEAEQVRRGQAQRLGRAGRLGGVLEEDRRAALRADHRVVRVLQHQHAVADGQGERAAAAALAGDDR